MTSVEQYQPTKSDKARLEQEGVTLDEVLQFDMPPQEELEYLASVGYTLIDAILTFTNLKANILDSLANHLTPLVMTPSTLKQEQLTVAQGTFIRSVQRQMSGNPYPGKGFSIEKAQAILDKATTEAWTPRNFSKYYHEIQAMVTTN